MINKTRPERKGVESSPLTLAFLGDAVFELLARAWVFERSDAPLNQLSKETRACVSAVAQSKFYGQLEPLLTEEETAILKRGRNAKSNTVSKNAKITEYRRATGLEALFGYLFAQGNTERLLELFNKLMEWER